MQTVLAALALAASAVSAMPSSTWMMRGTSTGSEVVDFSVALPTRGQSILDDVLTAVSTPG